MQYSFFLCRGKSVSISSSSGSLSLQAEVSEVEKDLSLRKLLWQSLQEWETLVDNWKATVFEALSTETMQNDVNRFIEIVFMLEKGEDCICLQQIVAFLQSFEAQT